MRSRQPVGPSSIDAVLDTVGALEAVEAATEVVRASGHGGDVVLKSTPIGYLWDPTLAEFLAACDAQQARHRDHWDPPEPHYPAPVLNEEEFRLGPEPRRRTR